MDIGNNEVGFFDDRVVLLQIGLFVLRELAIHYAKYLYEKSVGT